VRPEHQPATISPRYHHAFTSKPKQTLRRTPGFIALANNCYRSIQEYGMNPTIAIARLSGALMLAASLMLMAALAADMETSPPELVGLFAAVP
jgi:hypothetical protein